MRLRAVQAAAGRQTEKSHTGGGGGGVETFRKTTTTMLIWGKGVGRLGVTGRWGGGKIKMAQTAPQSYKMVQKAETADGWEMCGVCGKRQLLIIHTHKYTNTQ